MDVDETRRHVEAGDVQVERGLLLREIADAGDETPNNPHIAAVRLGAGAVKHGAVTQNHVVGLGVARASEQDGQQGGPHRSPDCTAFLSWAELAPLRTRIFPAYRF